MAIMSGLCFPWNGRTRHAGNWYWKYPYDEPGKDRPAGRVNPDRIAADIAQAMEAGWKPKSRGRPFIFVLD